MATLPTIEELEKTIIEIFVEFKSARPGSCLMPQNFTTRWFNYGYRGDDFEKGMNSLIKKEYVTQNSNGMFCLTQKLFDDGVLNIPSIEFLEKELLHIYSEFKCRADEGLMIENMRGKWFEKGFTSEELKLAIDSLINKESLKIGNNNFICLTEKGFSEM